MEPVTKRKDATEGTESGGARAGKITTLALAAFSLLPGRVTAQTGTGKSSSGAPVAAENSQKSDFGEGLASLKLPIREERRAAPSKTPAKAEVAREPDPPQSPALAVGGAGYVKAALLSVATAVKESFDKSFLLVTLPLARLNRSVSSKVRDCVALCAAYGGLCYTGALLGSAAAAHIATASRITGGSLMTALGFSIAMEGASAIFKDKPNSATGRVIGFLDSKIAEPLRYVGGKFLTFSGLQRLKDRGETLREGFMEKEAGTGADGEVVARRGSLRSAGSFVAAGGVVALAGTLAEMGDVTQAAAISEAANGASPALVAAAVGGGMVLLTAGTFLTVPYHKRMGNFMSGVIADYVFRPIRSITNRGESLSLDELQARRKSDQETIKEGAKAVAGATICGLGINALFF